MNAPLARLYSSAPISRSTSVGDERRREQRHATRYSASVESSRGEQAGVVLADVSLHGCCISGEAVWLRQGAFVSIRIGQGATLKAVVRWVRGDSAGMEFLHAVPSDAREWHELMDIAG
ncbi:PilZ domain-containing protein [Novosphingobium sp. PhB165]|uniref:PilZ domain-containing protein n=1 Tax=Novosphingobium sp. PhB165 TaxID=2485105 RepID=UPI0010D66B70|nr:PilZ domain-containing protein [Novosphingobium sp. PhB165]TCM21609.1 PilZ domain-containing protein [Novosphingobium sp. PhB165]